MPIRTVLHHAYVQEGEPLPEAIESWEWIRHVASREDGTGLDIWWFMYPDEESD